MLKQDGKNASESARRDVIHYMEGLLRWKCGFAKIGSPSSAKKEFGTKRGQVEQQRVSLSFGLRPIISHWEWKYRKVTIPMEVDRIGAPTGGYPLD